MRYRQNTKCDILYGPPVTKLIRLCQLKQFRILRTIF